MSKGEELRLGTMRGFVHCLRVNKFRADGCTGTKTSWFIEHFLCSRHYSETCCFDTKKYKLGILPKEFTTILKKVTLKKTCKKTKTTLEEITQEMLNGDK